VNEFEKKSLADPGPRGFQLWGINSAKQHSQDPEDAQESDDEFRQAAQRIKPWGAGPLKFLASQTFFHEIVDFFSAS
jgi:hypothetical protein